MDRRRALTENELEEAEAEVHDLFNDVREDLAADLGGDPEDYRVDRSTADDGSTE